MYGSLKAKKASGRSLVSYEYDGVNQLTMKTFVKQSEGELLEKVSDIESHLIKNHIDELKSILVRARKENETYEWLIEKEREEFQELINNFSEVIDSFCN